MKKLFVIVIMFALAACSNQELIESKGSTQLKQLTDGTSNSKSWKIESAVLKNATNSGGIVISNLPNVKDDEFVFSGSSTGSTYKASLVWNFRNEIRTDAAQEKQVLLDYYLSPSLYELTIQSNGEIFSSDPNLQIEIVSGEKVSLLYKKGSAELQINLTPSAARVSQTQGTLAFEKISDITGKGLEQAAGFTGSMASNSLYLAYRNQEVAGQFHEEVMKFDINTGLYKSQSFNQSDFVTKEIHIINDQLKVVGGQYVHTYSLDLDKDVVSASHGLILTRFGSTVVDNNIFLFGGDLQGASDNIYAHDQATNKSTPVGKFPETRFWAHGEIVDGKLYSFGGRQEFNTDVAEDDIFEWDIVSGQTKTYKLPKPMHRTFASRYQHLIIVGGQYEVANQNTTSIEVETAFGVFNTHDNTFTVVPTNLNASGQNSVFGLTIIDNTLYILYGSNQSEAFSIHKASLESL
jgi:hypothetical protein